MANRQLLEAEITAVFAPLTRAEVIDRLDQAQIANAALNSVQAFMTHPQLAARQRWRQVDSSAGKLPALLPPVTMSQADPLFKPIPEIGEHTETILKELGYEAAAIARFRAEQVI